MPIFSIVVVSYNAEDYIRKTIESVLSQTFTDYEIIVKDALSSDSTLDNVPSDERIKIFSFKDDGIYDGMNQGILYSNGQYICFLNCGDIFYDKYVLENIFNVIKNSVSEEVFYYGNYETKGYFTQSPRVTTRFSLYRNPLCHQTMFIPRSLFDKFGYYRKDFRILGDYDFTVHCLDAGVRFCNTDVTICKYLGDGASTQKKHRKVIDNEYRVVRRTYFTKIERFRFNIKIMLTFPKLRKYLASDRSPKFLRNLYMKTVNYVKKKR